MAWAGKWWRIWEITIGGWMKCLIIVLYWILDGRIEFIPLEDRIGIVRTGKAWDESYVFFLRLYVGVYYLKNQITHDKL